MLVSTWPAKYFHHVSFNPTTTMATIASDATNIKVAAKNTCPKHRGVGPKTGVVHVSLPRRLRK